MLLELPYVAADTETTGFAPDRGDRICEIAFLKFYRGEVVDRISTLVNPGVPMPPDATKVNGITNGMIADAPTFAEVLPAVLAFVRGKPLVFHNAPFDMGFLRAEAVRANTVWPKLPVFDTLDMARQSGQFRDNRLATICDALEIKRGNHRAESDAWATGRVLLHLARHPRVRLRDVA